jgi:hypothetical protein
MIKLIKDIRWEFGSKKSGGELNRVPNIKIEEQILLSFRNSTESKIVIVTAIWFLGDITVREIESGKYHTIVPFDSGLYKLSETERIYEKAIGFNGEMEDKWIGTVFHHLKMVTPTHGYFPEHPLSKKTESVAEKLGYEYNAR